MPAPHAAKTCVIMLSGCWTGASGKACADDDASAKANATETIRNMGCVLQRMGVLYMLLLNAIVRQLALGAPTSVRTTTGRTR